MTQYLYFLLLASIVSLYFHIVFIVGLSPTAHALDPLPMWATYIDAAFVLGNIVFVKFLLQWKKWAFWGLAVSIGFSIIIGLMVKGGVALFGLVGLAVLYLLFRPKWHLLE